MIWLILLAPFIYVFLGVIVIRLLIFLDKNRYFGKVTPEEDWADLTSIMVLLWPFMLCVIVGWGLWLLVSLVPRLLKKANIISRIDGGLDFLVRGKKASS
jgi:hypothetical protein